MKRANIDHLSKVLSISLICLWALYVAGSAVVLNTPLFQKLTDMEDPNQTQIDLKGALSPFPGLLWIHHANIWIRDQNVSLLIEANHAWVRFELPPLLQKTFRTRTLRIGSAQIQVGFKTPEEKANYLNHFTRPKDVDLDLKSKMANGNREKRIHLDFAHLEIQKIEKAEFPWGALKGDISLRGGFSIQPGVEVEVYPTTLLIHHGEIQDQFKEIEAKVEAHFNKFFIPDAPGNAIYQFVTADVQAKAFAQNLRFLDTALRSLPHPELFGGQANIITHLQIDQGHLLPNSFLKTEKNKIVLHSAHLHAEGIGQVNWEMKKNFSDFDLQLSQASASPIDQSSSMHGYFEKAELKMRLYGTELDHLFHGFVASLSLRGSHFQVKENHHHFAGELKMTGDLFGHSGTLPLRVLRNIQKKASNLVFTIQSFTLSPKDLPPLRVQGTVKTTSHSVNLDSFEYRFPKVDSNLKVDFPKQNQSEVFASLDHLEYQSNPIGTWKGHLNLLITETAPWIQLLQDQNQISGLPSAFAKVHQVSMNVDWEKGDHFTWLRFNEILSTGLWKAYGSLLDEGQGFMGAFEAKVAEIPIGILISPHKLRVSPFPKSNWYTKPR